MLNAVKHLAKSHEKNIHDKNEGHRADFGERQFVPICYTSIAQFAGESSKKCVIFTNVSSKKCIIPANISSKKCIFSD